MNGLRWNLKETMSYSCHRINKKIVFKQLNLVQTSKIVVTNFSKLTIINTQKIMSNFMKDWNN